MDGVLSPAGWGDADRMWIRASIPSVSRSSLMGCVLALTAPVVMAEDVEPISTDRPDFVESSLVVHPRQVQIETSAEYGRVQAHDADHDSWTTPTLLRLGLAPDWEARLETEGFARVQEGSTHESGFSEVSLGTKWHAGDQALGGASTAVLLHVDLPTGEPAFRGRGARPSLRGVAEWELSEHDGLGVMPGLVWNTDDQGDRYLGLLLGATFGHAWTDHLRSFVEVVGEDLRDTRDAPAQFRFDTGVAWLLTRDTQIDTAAYLGLNDATPDVALTIGLSSRW